MKQLTPPANNVEVDDRRYIYIVGRADTGLRILGLTGGARAITNVAGKGN